MSTEDDQTVATRLYGDTGLIDASGDITVASMQHNGNDDVHVDMSQDPQHQFHQQDHHHHHHHHHHLQEHHPHQNHMDASDAETSQNVASVVNEMINGPGVEAAAMVMHHHDPHQDSSDLSMFGPSTCIPAADGLSAPGNQSENSENDNPAKRKRYCRYPGCNRVIKSQGHCQRHGAKAKRCKIEGCTKQAQGTHDGMCKRHWKAFNNPQTVASQAEADEVQPPVPQGESVYDNVLPQSISYRPSLLPTALPTPPIDGKKISEVSGVMPLVSFLRDGATREVGWHRNAERKARGYFPVTSLAMQFEPWERQLVLVEILLLSGGTPYANFRDLAHAWGREKGFHTVLANSVCGRRGEIQRKRRSDAGKAGNLKPPASQTQQQEQQEQQPVSVTASFAAAAAVSTAALANNPPLPLTIPKEEENTSEKDMKLPPSTEPKNKRHKPDSNDDNSNNDDSIPTFEDSTSQDNNANSYGAVV